ncbi:MAG: substrate-binding domain-containing protein [Opitutaceae bacterium]|nr:substrate-binding domain-containing protein [Opitutaceae bacterium]
MKTSATLRILSVARGHFTRLPAAFLLPACLLLAGPDLAGASDTLDPDIAPYQPGPTIVGDLRAWGYQSFRETMKVWAERFEAHYPGIRFGTKFATGTSPANAAILTGVAEFGLFGREIRPGEIVSFGRVYPYEQLPFRVAGGAFDTPNKTPALGVYVHRDNPLRRLTLTQLDAIFSRDRLRGGTEAIRTWGQLGLTGEWADKPITIYGMPQVFGTAEFLRLRVLRDGAWAAEVMLPPGSPTHLSLTAGEEYSHAAVKAMEADRYAICFLVGRYATSRMRSLALAEHDGGAYFDYTRENVLTRDYPLSRVVYIVVNKDPTKPWDPKVREFLAFVLSREGQQAVADAGTFLPLPESVLAIERQKLAQ